MSFQNDVLYTIIRTALIYEGSFFFSSELSQNLLSSRHSGSEIFVGL